MKHLLPILIAASFFVGCATTEPMSEPPISEPPGTVASPTESTSAPTIDYRSPAERVLSPDEMQKDLAFVVESLARIHPGLVDGFDAEQAHIVDEAAAEIIHPLPFYEFVRVVSQVLSVVDDGNTGIRIPSEVSRPSLPTVRVEAGLFAYVDIAGVDGDGLKAGDEIVGVSDVPIGALAGLLERRLALASRPSRGDRRYDDLLLSDLLMATIGTSPAAPSVSLAIVRDGRLAEASLPRLTDAGELAAYSADPPTYTTDGGRRFPRVAAGLEEPQVTVLASHETAYLRVDTLAAGAELNEALAELFTATTMERLSTVVVDLRYSGGGDPRAVREFLRYLGVREYASFTTVTRYSEAAAEQFGYRRTNGTDIQRDPIETLEPLKFPSLIFDGQVYVLVSSHTRGEAARFAAIVKQNDFGVLVGEPTGSGPAGFDDAVHLETPVLRLEFDVSHKLYLTPVGDDGGYIGSLAPDVIVRTRIEDVLSGYDRQMAYVLERARRGR